MLSSKTFHLYVFYIFLIYIIKCVSDFTPIDVERGGRNNSSITENIVLYIPCFASFQLAQVRLWEVSRAVDGEDENISTQNRNNIFFQTRAVLYFTGQLCVPCSHVYPPYRKHGFLSPVSIAKKTLARLLASSRSISIPLMICLANVACFNSEVW